MTIYIDDVSAGVSTVPGSASSGIPTHEELLARVDALVPRLRERAEETENLRRIPDITLLELQDAGVFRILAPIGVGGYGMGVETYGEVVRRLARGCPSTAWNAGHLMEHVWMLARWPQAVQDEVFAGGPAPLAAATGAPVGIAEEAPGGYLITGRWSFASGVLHSQWALLAVDHNGVRLQCLVPINDVEIVDTWHTAGLRGTGSNDIHAQQLFVPARRAAAWTLLTAEDNPGSRIHPDPIISTPMGTLLNIVAPSAALGAAEHALELFREQMQAQGQEHCGEPPGGLCPCAGALRPGLRAGCHRAAALGGGGAAGGCVPSTAAEDHGGGDEGAVSPVLCPQRRGRCPGRQPDHGPLRRKRPPAFASAPADPAGCGRPA